MLRAMYFEIRFFLGMPMVLELSPVDSRFLENDWTEMSFK